MNALSPGCICLPLPSLRTHTLFPSPPRISPGLLPMAASACIAAAPWMLLGCTHMLGCIASVEAVAYQRSCYVPA